MAEAGWVAVASLVGALGDGPVSGMEDLFVGPMLLWLAGEFAEPDVKAKIWAAADERCEPTWNRDSGEFTLGFGLDEPYPRGQINARAMAGWVCTPGAWSRIFNEPNLAKFDQPTVTGVDFPRVALSEARWDGNALHLAAHPQNSAVAGTRTSMQITNLPHAAEVWSIERPDGESETLHAERGALEIELVVDNDVTVVRRFDASSFRRP